MCDCEDTCLPWSVMPYLVYELCSFYKIANAESWLNPPPTFRPSTLGHTLRVGWFTVLQMWQKQYLWLIDSKVDLAKLIIMLWLCWWDTRWQILGINYQTCKKIYILFLQLCFLCICHHGTMLSVFVWCSTYVECALSTWLSKVILPHRQHWLVPSMVAGKRNWVIGYLANI